MKKILLYAVTAALTLSMTGCRIDDNIDPNNPLNENLSPRNRITAAETATFSAQSGNMFSLSRIWTNTVAGNYYQYAAPMTAEYQMNITSSSGYGNIWNGNYLALANLAAIIEGKDAEQFPLHVAIAKILMANGMQYIVDFYGDAPYTEAFKQQEILNPKYDKGEDIYKDLVIKINEAIEAINNNPDPASNIAVTGNEDVIFGGDMQEWVKYANTIKLRLLLRQSKVTDGAIAQFNQEQLASLVGASFVDGDVTINPGYTNATEQQLNPLYLNFGAFNFSYTANNNAGYRYYKVSDHFAKLMNGDASKPTAGLVDPRGTKIYRAVGGKLVGIQQGQSKPEGTSDGQFSYPGGWMYTAPEDGGSRDGYMMLKSEAELLLAEAAVLYPQYFSGAQSHYTNAVNESFTFLGLTGAQATAYLNGLNTKSVGWAGSADKMNAIQYQRLVILNNYKPYETYINYLKTGYPETPLALTALYPNKPYRLPYPISETIGNSANVPKFDTAELFVKNQYTPFWNRN